MNNQDLKLIIEQRQVLKPKLIPSLNLLQMSVFDLNNYISEIVEENPVAEKIEIETNEKTNKQKGSDIIELIDYSDNGVTLYDYVYSQILDSLKNEKDIQIAKYILNSLDKDGYFKEDLKQTSIILDCETKDVLKILTLIKKCEPCGVGTKDLKESLIRQLEKKENSLNAINIVKYHLDDFANNQYYKIIKSLRIEYDDLEEAGQLIKNCNPRPANGFAGREKINYIIPEVTVKNNNGKINVTIEENNYCKLEVNDYYKNYLKEVDGETKTYLKEKISQINNINYFIERRKESIRRVVSYIINKQVTYFSTGNEIDLIPLIQKDIARDLNISISTVSRVISNKYIECEHGIFPISFFVKESVSGNITKVQILNLIKKIVNSEEKDAPFSDRSISSKLEVFGVHLSRRTITKYRKELGYASKNQRRL